MELCPRCASVVADSAQSCGGCGAPIWQPTPRETIAVTPAPVALVLPAAQAAATPPPVPATTTPPPLPTTSPALPPQRVTSPASPAQPDPVPVNPSVLPAAHPSHHWAAGGGAFVAILVVVVLILALPAHGAKHSNPLAVATSKDAQFDLRALAAAEETSLTATRVYTTDVSALAAFGYQPLPDAPVTILAGIHRKSGYCLVASAGDAKPWFLFDSEQGGLVDRGFASQVQAQQACADPAIDSFTSVT
ncbi:MAG TPA: hypothetical protein VHE57_09525 [Mycobacteriales bacterium]|nr:hypothetical protein [Mycobacteriales bacterium]